eukprot:TCALIF_01953-PA protein Name:"Similar to USP46 Ubiquitin carboxyl-terminal hydrolase 46 (Pongo abelii)" AED:0.17 eAED:0.17 QI:0/0.8/0.63/0.90/1/1/11/530/644
MGGGTASQLEKDIGSDLFPANEHFFGLVNFGNTCYSNSVLQALYFCKPFREKVLEYKAKNKRSKETLLTCLADLFHSIATQKKRVGTIAPKKFIARLRKEKVEFDNYMQQDAHEFLNFLINHINETIIGERTVVSATGKTTNNNKTNANSDGGGSSSSHGTENKHTWINDIFQGILTSETRCLNCETVTSKDEDFFDLSIDIEQNTSLTSCLRNFSRTETLCSDNKFKCDTCSAYQEAQKCMRVKQLPTILALHLKRFKYMEQFNRHIKVSHRVVFPLELRLFNTSDDAVNPDRMYDLVAVVIHCGSGPNRGHYISIVKSCGFWLIFDDDIVDVTCQEAWKVLEQDGAAIDAVEHGCSRCESEQCDGTVGFGGSPDESGETTLDSMIMDGETFNVGAVAALRRVKSAISVARKVLENTHHSILAGSQATLFAKQMGFEEEWLNTTESENKWQTWRENNCQPNFWTNVSPDPSQNCGPYESVGQEAARVPFGQSGNHDTIGMIALDSNGKMVAGTSTNGANHKIPGRVGDSPIPGAGAYVDSEVGGAAATGDGDVMLRLLPSFTAVEAMRSGMSPQLAAQEAIDRITKKYPDFIGAVVALKKSGEFGAACHGIAEFPFSVANKEMGGAKVIVVTCQTRTFVSRNM